MKKKDYELNVLKLNLLEQFSENQSEDLLKTIGGGDNYYFIPSNVGDLLLKHLEKHENHKNFHYVENFLQIAQLIAVRDGKRISSRFFKNITNNYASALLIFETEFHRKPFSRKKNTCFLYEYNPTIEYSLISLKNLTTDEKKLKFDNELPLNHASNNSLHIETLMEMQINISEAIRKEINYYKHSGNSIQNLISRLNRIFKFNLKRGISLGKNVNRIYSINLSKISRKCLMINGNYFVGLDISNCQPLLLNIFLLKRNLEIDDNYLKDTIKGNIYENLLKECKRLNLKEDKIYNPKSKENELFPLDNKNNIKILICRSVLFEQKTEKESNFVKAFNSLYPKTFNSLQNVNQKRKSLARELQNLEAKIMVENKFKTLLKNKIHYFTLHDCIYFEQVENWKEIAEKLKIEITNIISKMSKGKINEVKFKLENCNKKEEEMEKVAEEKNFEVKTIILNGAIKSGRRIREKNQLADRSFNEFRYSKWDNFKDKDVMAEMKVTKPIYYSYANDNDREDFDYNYREEELDKNNNLIYKEEDEDQVEQYITCTKVGNKALYQDVTLKVVTLKNFKEIKLVLSPYNFELLDSIDELARIDKRYKTTQYINNILQKEKNNIIDYENNVIKTLSYHYNDKLYLTFNYKSHLIEDDGNTLYIPINLSFNKKSNDAKYDISYEDYKLTFGNKFERLNDSLFFEEDDNIDLKIYDLSKELNFKDFKEIKFNIDYYFDSKRFVDKIKEKNRKFKNKQNLIAELQSNKDKIIDVENSKVNFVTFNYGDDLIGTFEYSGHIVKQNKLTIKMLFDVRNKDGEVFDVEELYEKL